MADDRVYIKCKFCGGWKMLLKFFTASGSTTRDNGILEFLNNHAKCHPNLLHDNLGGDPGFVLHVESERKFKDHCKPDREGFFPDKEL